MSVVSSNGRAPDRKSGCRGFDSRTTPGESPPLTLKTSTPRSPREAGERLVGRERGQTSIARNCFGGRPEGWLRANRFAVDAMRAAAPQSALQSVDTAFSPRWPKAAEVAYALPSE